LYQSHEKETSQLGAIRAEKKAAETVLEKTKKKLTEATDVVETAGIRSRAIERKLKDVQELPVSKSVKLLDTNEEIPAEES